MTAAYVKNFTADIFDIRLGETEFISDKKSLNISASIDCGEGMVPNNGSCGMYFFHFPYRFETFIL
jgi:hypothetical protein